MLRRISLSMAACAALGLAAVAAQAQPSNVTSNQTVSFPPNNPVIEIRASLPDEVRVGESFEYQVEVANVTDNISLRDVRIEQIETQGLSIESAQIQPDRSQQSNQQTGSRQARQRTTNNQGRQQGQQRDQQRRQQDSDDQQGQQDRNQQDQNQQGQNQQGQNQQGRSQNQNQQDQNQQDRNQQSQNQQGQSENTGARNQRNQQDRASQQGQRGNRQGRQQGEQRQAQRQGRQQQGQNSWMIDSLEPGQTRTIRITATAQQEGGVDTCLAVASYTPVLCMTTRAVQPDLEIVKQAPERANVCEQLEWEYYVKNRGSGNPGQFVIQDDLPPGIQTITGDQQLWFEVDGLEPGDTRKFVAQLQAMRTGEFSSPAMAIRGEGKSTRSRSVGTRVVGADLAISLDGPQTRYVNRLVDYTVRITNHGEAAAEDAQLILSYPDAVQLAHVGNIQASDREVPRGASSGMERARQASDQDQAQGNRRDRQRQNRANNRGGQGNSTGKQNQNQDRENNQGNSRNNNPNNQVDDQDSADSQSRGNQGDQGNDRAADQADPSQGNQQGQNRQGQNRQGRQRNQAQQDQNQQGQNQQGQNQQGQQRNLPKASTRPLSPSQDRSWSLGTLEPGQTVEINFTVRGTQRGRAMLKAEVMHICGTGDQAQEESALAQATTQLIALPALSVAVVDDMDPVPVNENFRYAIVIENEGEAIDKDIRVSVDLPQELEFVEASGVTEATSEGQTVQFGAVDELRPGEKIRWNVTTKPTQTGNVRLKVDVQSQFLSRTTSAEEPTVLFDGNSQQGSNPSENTSGR